MMLSLNSTVGKVFTIYAVFWVVVFLVLFFGVGALIRRQERTLEENRRRGSGGGH